MAHLNETSSSTSDFAKKLYNMLEDPSLQNIVAWGPKGDCFVVKDMNEFTTGVLPRLFKHSNFASFVRQLNKYDFHKAKSSEDEGFNENSWVFRHPDFHRSRPDALEHIKRKVPGSSKRASAAPGPPLQHHMSMPMPSPTSGPSSAYTASSAYTGYPPPQPPPPHIQNLQTQVERLTQSQNEMQNHIQNLEQNYHDVLVEMVGFQRTMAQQDGLMQNLIQYLLQEEQDDGRVRDLENSARNLGHV